MAGVKSVTSVVALALAAVCHGGKSFCTQFALGPLKKKWEGNVTNWRNKYSLILRSAADCIAQQKCRQPYKPHNYAPSLPNHNWPLHWSMPALLSLKGRALIFSSPLIFCYMKKTGRCRPFSPGVLVIMPTEKSPFLFFSPLFLTSAPLQFISSLPAFLLTGCRASQTWF